MTQRPIFQPCSSPDESENIRMYTHNLMSPTRGLLPKMLCIKNPFTSNEYETTNLGLEESILSQDHQANLLCLMLVLNLLYTSNPLWLCSSDKHIIGTNMFCLL